MADPVVFDRPLAERVIAAANRLDAMPVGPRAGQASRGRGGRLVDVFRVTGAGVLSAGGRTYYPARLQVFTDEDGIADYTTDNAIWLIHPGAAALTTDGTGFYFAICILDQLTIGGATRPVFLTVNRPFVTNAYCDAGDIINELDG